MFGEKEYEIFKEAFAHVSLNQQMIDGCRGDILEEYGALCNPQRFGE